MAVSDEVIWQNVLTHFADLKGFDSRRDQLSLDTETGEVHVVNRDEDFTKKGALCGCICGLIFCNCSEVLLHREACSYRKAVLFSFFECDHGAYACPLCDECTCGIGINDAEWQEIRATRRVWVALSFGLVGVGFTLPREQLSLAST